MDDEIRFDDANMSCISSKQEEILWTPTGRRGKLRGDKDLRQTRERHETLRQTRTGRTKIVTH